MAIKFKLLGVTMNWMSQKMPIQFPHGIKEFHGGWFIFLCKKPKAKSMGIISGFAKYNLYTRRGK